MTTIQIERITKLFGRTRALNNVSFTLQPHKIYGLLGRNGAGKTTLLNLITNKIFPDSGRVVIDGQSALENDRVLSRVYCMSEKNIHPWNMKAKDGLRWAREFHPAFNLEYAGALAEKFKLDTGKKIKSLSSGYSSILKLILTLASGAPVMIFDEPVLGLDAAHRELFYRELLAYYSENQNTVIIATHLIDEVAEVLEEVVILRDGELVLAEPVETVLERAYSVSGESGAVDRYTAGKKVVKEENFGKFKVATVFQYREKEDRDRISRMGLEMIPAKLQEIFISLTAG